MHPSNRLEAIHEILPDRFAICGGLVSYYPIAIFLKCVSILENRYRKGDPRGASSPWPFTLPLFPYYIEPPIPLNTPHPGTPPPQHATASCPGPARAC